MPSIRDYLFAYGKLDWTLNPFNEVDGLILSQFIYMNFEGVVDRAPVPMSQVCARMLQKPDFSTMYPFMQQDDATLLVCLALRPRFRDCPVLEYENCFNEDRQEQFTAISVDLPHARIIAIRGTDTSLAGWKESFNLAFEKPIPAQRRAIEYVNKMGASTSLPLIVVGHSKGGNLAVFAASFCKREVQDRILRVYSYDGPGLNRRQAESPSHLLIKPRVQVFIPRGSFVGTLFTQEDALCYVQAGGLGLMQHYSYSWLVEGMGFVQAQRPTDPSAFMSATLRQLIEELSMEEKRLLVESLYEILNASECRELNTLFTEWKTRGFMMLRYYKQLPQDTRKRLLGVARVFLQAAAGQLNQAGKALLDIPEQKGR